MIKGQKIAHAPRCKGGKCRGGCWKSKQNKRLVESMRDAQKANKDAHILVTGQQTQGKSAAMVDWISRMDAKPGSIQFDIGSYMNQKEKQLQADRAANPMYEAYKQGKEERLAQITADRLCHWETLGRLLGKAYAESDAAFFRLLEGMYRGKLNEQAGRDALGRRREE